MIAAFAFYTMLTNEYLFVVNNWDSVNHEMLCSLSPGQVIIFITLLILAFWAQCRSSLRVEGDPM